MADINLGVGGANSATGVFNIDNSVKFEANNTEYMKFASSQSGSDLYRMAFNIWLKRTEIGRTQTFMLLGNGGSNSTRLDLSFDSSDRLQVRNVNSNWRLTKQVFRDTSAWYHLFFQIDTTQSTADDRIKVWVNGNLIAIADYTTVQDPGLNAVLGFNRNYSNILGGREIGGSNSQMFSGYIAQVYGSGGTPPSVTDFGEFDEDTGIWKPKDISGISPPEPINGFFLDFSDASDLGNDASGNNNNFTLNNITSADQATDTPTNNFATMNPLWNYYNEVPRVTISDGGTRLTGNQSNTLWRGIPSTIAVTAGKWYWEVERGYGGNGIMVGYGSTENIGWRELTTVPGSGSGKMMYSLNGDIYGYDAAEDNRTQYAGNFNTLGDIVSIALDVDNGWAYTRYNGAAWHSSGDPSSGSTGTGAISIPWSPEEPTVFVVTIPNNNQDTRVNFGGYTTTANTLSYSDSNNYGAFKYEVPSGYYALCTKNLAEYG